MHFPRNINYKEIEKTVVKKTLQGDLSKLLKYNLISRIYKKPPKPREGKRFYRQEGYYSITMLGIDYIKLYKIVQQPAAEICQ